jgi:carboxypeptidase Q
MRIRTAAALLTLTVAAALPAAQQPVEKIDLDVYAKIRDEGLNRSQVMDHIGWLADVYGPRLTGGPQIDAAAGWAEKKFAEWGLANVHRERFAFGRGWSLVRFSGHMIEPQVQPLIGSVPPWTRGTNGTITADVVRVEIESEKDFERYRGKLKGAIVLTQPARAVPMLEGTVVHRMGPDDIKEAMTPPAPRGGGGRAAGRGAAGRGRGASGPSLAQQIQEFYRTEGVAALFNRGGDTVMTSIGSGLSAEHQRTDGGTVFPSGGGSRTSDPESGFPTVTLAVEHYNRMVRILEKGLPVKVELNIQTEFHEETQPNAFNLIADIPGTDPKLKDEVVIIGAHFDSVAAATGATDNATGSAAMMEAMRIIKTLGLQPRRTIRLALWGAEEQGLLGSREYVRQHIADVQAGTVKPGFEQVSVYFNSDNGTGRIRGVWLEGNTAVAPIFQQWIAPLKDLGVEILSPWTVGSTDHVAFDSAGIPGFQFVVDRLEYRSRTHHSSMDFVDRVQPDDMKQHATVAAIFAYNAAMRDEKLPRKPRPETTAQR